MPLPVMHYSKSNTGVDVILIIIIIAFRMKFILNFKAQEGATMCRKYAENILV